MPTNNFQVGYLIITLLQIFHIVAVKEFLKSVNIR